MQNWQNPQQRPGSFGVAFPDHNAPAGNFQPMQSSTGGQQAGNYNGGFYTQNATSSSYGGAANSGAYGGHSSIGIGSGSGVGAGNLDYYSGMNDDMSSVSSAQYANQGSMSGSIGSSGAFGNTQTSGFGSEDSSSTFEEDLPLLEELGIDFSHIKSKTIAVLAPHKPIPPAIMQDTDLAGPLVFCLCLGFFLMLTGKIHFGYIYGFGIVGCLLMYMILNLMSEDTVSIDIYLVMSILGYCLLPIVMLAGVAVVLNLKGLTGMVLTPIAILWCTVTATRFFEKALEMHAQRFLIAYPAALLFSCFAMITVF